MIPAVDLGLKQHLDLTTFGYFQRMSAQYLEYLDVVSPNFVKTSNTKKQRELLFHMASRL